MINLDKVLLAEEKPEFEPMVELYNEAKALPRYVASIMKEHDTPQRILDLLVCAENFLQSAKELLTEKKTKKEVA